MSPMLKATAGQSHIFCRLSTMHEHDRQTNRQTGNIDRNRQNRLSAMSPNNDKIKFFFIISVVRQLLTSFSEERTTSLLNIPLYWRLLQKNR